LPAGLLSPPLLLLLLWLLLLREPACQVPTGIHQLSLYLTVRYHNRLTCTPWLLLLLRQPTHGSSSNSVSGMTPPLLLLLLLQLLHARFSSRCCLHGRC
jgi:hypothetical protein